jgi:2-dehydro-3-deoxygluconokinase
MKTPLDVVTYGEAMTMFVAAETGDLAKVGQFTKRVAGADLNVAIGLSRLGFRVGWMSRVGHDSFVRYVLDVLAHEGIDAGCVTIDERYPTAFQLKSKNDDGSDPAIEYFRKGSAASHLSLDDYVADYVLGARHMEAEFTRSRRNRRCNARQMQMAREMRKAGKTISFDPNLRPTLWPSREAMAEALNALAALADWVMPGVSEGKILTGFAKPEDIARFYLDQGAKGVVVKLGAQGAYFRTADNEEGTVPAIPVKNVVDTVGAGDGFALAIQVIGDSEGLPTRSELDALEQAGGNGTQASGAPAAKVAS